MLFKFLLEWRNSPECYDPRRWKDVYNKGTNGTIVPRAGLLMRPLGFLSTSTRVLCHIMAMKRQ